MLKRLLLALTLSAIGFPAAAAEMEFGLAKAKFEDRPWTTTEHREFMLEYGANDFAAVFWNLLSPDNLEHSFDWVRDNYLRAGCKPVIITLLPNGVDEDSIAKSELSEGENRAIGNHDVILAGLYDEAVEAFAIRLKRAVEQSDCPDYRPTINLMHEAGGRWYAWGMDAIGNSAESYAAAYLHIVDIFQRVDAPVDFQLNLNRRDGEGEVMRLIDVWFPLLDPVVDRYAISSYNRCGTTSEATEYRSFWSEFGPAYRTLAERTDKPIDVAEVSTSTLCRDMEAKLVWFEEMLAALELYAPQTERVTFFFGDIAEGEASNEVVIEWGFRPEYRDDFRAILERFKEAAVRPAEPAAPTRRVAETTAPASNPKPVTVVQAEPELRFDAPSLAPPEGSDLNFGRSWTYEGWFNLTHPFDDEPVPGYGRTGLLGQGTFRLSYLTTGDVRHGPYGLLGGVVSNNCDPRFWQCQARIEAGYTWRLDTKQEFGFGDYNTTRLDLGCGYRYYWQSAGRPGRLDDGDAYCQVGLTWVFGGEFR